MTDPRSLPVDPEAAAQLAERGLVYRKIDTGSDDDAAAFVRAHVRGFMDPDPGAEFIAASQRTIADRRNMAVFDAAAADGLPVATVNAWLTPLTIPGGEIDMWVVSSVTVAAPYRRRGIARAMIEAELRSAARSGAVLAGLTASEATIYGRYGFASAVPVARVRIDAVRAGWIGAEGSGRVEYIDREMLARELAAVHEVARSRRSGEMPGWPLRWSQVAGLSPDHPSARAVRGVRHVDADGRTTGVLAYRLTQLPIPGVFRYELDVQHLVTADDEALRALWRFALQHDLVGSVVADLRPVDDPITRLVADQRAVEMTVHDHGWLRILDLPAALSARTYRADVDAVLQVRDGLGFAEGTWRVSVVDGAATVTASDAVPDAVLDVAALSAVYVGGETVTRLRAAGLVDATAEVAASLDDALRTPLAPTLSI